MTKHPNIKPGTVVQLSPNADYPRFARCMLTVTEVNVWGCLGYVQGVGKNSKPGGQAYYRARWDEMELVGSAVWVAGSRGRGQIRKRTVDNE